MNASNQFMELVKDAPTVDDEPVQPLANTFMRFCQVCMEIMPHYREETYCQCVGCETKTYRRAKSERGQALIEMMLLTALVLFVLIYVCKDWPW